MKTPETFTEAVQLNVADSHWITNQENNGIQERVETTEPYERIVGISMDDQHLFAPEVVAADNESSFTPEKTTPLEISLPGQLPENLFSFFKSFLSEDASHSIRTDFNCHRFAAWMHGDKLEANVDSRRKALRVVNLGQNVGSLALGEAGVIGYKDLKHPHQSHAYHSLIGLEDDMTLQIMWLYGHLGIASTKDIVGHYNGLFKKNKPTRQFGLYSLER